jgi:hypothetical protein
VVSGLSSSSSVLPLRPNRNHPYRGTVTPTTTDTKVVNVSCAHIREVSIKH